METMLKKLMLLIAAIGAYKFIRKRCPLCQKPDKIPWAPWRRGK